MYDEQILEAYYEELDLLRDRLFNSDAEVDERINDLETRIKLLSSK